MSFDHDLLLAAARGLLQAVLRVQIKKKNGTEFHNNEVENFS